ncbi:tetratricopeptide repeat protein [Streptomyces sp. NPDC102259]|uniref:tetratricopeptide repeat protein n=1 Tax=Streptomyces sp. NPDC102259 TaxID=3366148 RepID=UPI003807B148
MEWQALLAGALSVMAPGLTDDEDPSPGQEPDVVMGLTRRMGVTYDALGPPPERASPKSGRSAQFGGSPEDLLALAREYAEHGNPLLAAGLFERVHAQRPGDADILAELADVLAAAGRYPEAEARFRQALTLPSDRPVALRPVAGLAWLLRARDRTAEAEALLRPGLTPGGLREVLSASDPPDSRAAYRRRDDHRDRPESTTAQATRAAQEWAAQRAAARAVAATAERAAGEQAVAERKVEELQAFEREYRTRLKSFLESQLRQVEQAMRPEPDEPPPATRRPERGLTDPRALEREYLVRMKAFLESQLRELDPRRDLPPALAPVANAPEPEPVSSESEWFRRRRASTRTGPDEPASAAAGTTASGLPRRVRRASPIAGAAGPSERPSAARVPEDVRGRLTNLRRGIAAARKSAPQHPAAGRPEQEQPVQEEPVTGQGNDGEEER